MSKILPTDKVTKIRSYIDDGVPLEDLFRGEGAKRDIERVQVAEQVYELFCQDPMLDINRCLRRTFGRTHAQLELDKQVIELFVDSLDTVSRKMMVSRARKTAESLVRIGQQTGDPKWVDKGLARLIDIDRLDEEEVEQENVRNTAALPMLLVGIDMVNPERESVDDTAFRQLIRKYNGKEDDFSKLMEVRKRRMMGEDMGKLAYEELE